MHTKQFLLFLVIGFYLSACSTSQVINNTPIESKTKTDEINENDEILISSQLDWVSLREDLSTPFKNDSSSIAYFEEEPKNQADELFISNQGFRIQLDRTRNLPEADSIKGEYNLKMNTWDIRYKAPAYVVYKAPYYRIHIGDFTERKKALDYNKFIKQYYPAAWVVADRVETNLIPQYEELIESINPSLQDSVKN